LSNAYRITIVIVVIAIIVLSGFIVYRYITGIKSQVNTLETVNSKLSADNTAKDSIISSKNIYITNLEKQVNSLKSQLADMTLKYEQAKPYEDRVVKGQDMTQSYLLLNDINQYTKPIALQILGLTSSTTPANDDELWDRGRKVYNWLSNNFKYCGDKGLRVGSTFYEFQFWSPDEILQSDNARCGDCDDFAMLYAGLMYASGVPKDKVTVVCGTVPQGGHCWDWITLNSKTYRIDPVCSQKQTILNILGLDLGIKAAYYTSTKENVQCFDNYTEQMKMNPNGFSLI
jgi:hypothetical protein